MTLGYVLGTPVRLRGYLQCKLLSVERREVGFHVSKPRNRFAVLVDLMFGTQYRSRLGKEDWLMLQAKEMIVGQTNTPRASCPPRCFTPSSPCPAPVFFIPSTLRRPYDLHDRMSLFSLTSLSSESDLSDGFTIVIPTIAKKTSKALKPPSPNAKTQSRELVSRRRARSSSRERDTVTSATRSTLSSFTASSNSYPRRRARSPTERTWSYTYDSDASSESDETEGYSRPGTFFCRLMMYVILILDFELTRWRYIPRPRPHRRPPRSPARTLLSFSRRLPPRPSRRPPFTRLGHGLASSYSATKCTSDTSVTDVHPR